VRKVDREVNMQTYGGDPGEIFWRSEVGEVGERKETIAYKNK
jgi:hypothetical protein